MFLRGNALSLQEALGAPLRCVFCPTGIIIQMSLETRMARHCVFICTK